MQLSGASENPSSHEQRIARQKKADEHPGFDEDYNANHERPAPIEQAANVVKAGQNLLQEFDHVGSFPQLFRSHRKCKSSKDNSIKARRREP